MFGIRTFLEHVTENLLCNESKYKIERTFPSRFISSFFFLSLLLLDDFYAFKNKKLKSAMALFTLEL